MSKRQRAITIPISIFLKFEDRQLKLSRKNERVKCGIENVMRIIKASTRNCCAEGVEAAFAMITAAKVGIIRKIASLRFCKKSVLK